MFLNRFAPKLFQMEVLAKSRIRRSLEWEALVVESKRVFEESLKEELNLVKVGAPLYVSKKSGLNDDLNGVEEPVSFELNGEEFQIVHSLAKWKRWYLGELDVPKGKGIVTDMKAIRADEVLTEIHSHLVDQWDWEKVIAREERTVSTLIDHGQKVYNALLRAEEYISSKLGEESKLPYSINIIHSEDLLDEFPGLSAKDREHAACKKYGAVMLIGIGGRMINGERHDFRAPDYDDWSTTDKYGRKGLNADILVWDSVREKSLEISSMGIRVDEKALKLQLQELQKEDRLKLPFHKLLLEGKLPYTIGGGIGQSRVAMLVTRSKNIHEVQAPSEISFV